MRSISGMPSDELAGVAGRRVPLPNRKRANAKHRRKANAKHFWNAFRRIGRCRKAVCADTRKECPPTN